MHAEAYEWQFPGRVEFHLNGGWTKLLSWAGGPHWCEVRTDSIPVPLRRMATWVTIRLSSREGFSVLGPAEPQEWPWKNEPPWSLTNFFARHLNRV